MWPFKKQTDRAQMQAELEAMRAEMATIKAESATFSITDAGRASEVFGAGGYTSSGQLVTANRAMRYSAVYGCVLLISGAVACSTLRTYRADGDARIPAPQHRLAKMLRLQPNRFMTAATFWKFIAESKMLRGNAYAHIIRAKSGDVLALYPLKPGNVEVYQAWELGLDARLGVERNRLFYDVTHDDGTVRIYDQTDILHIPNIGFNGKKGLSTVSAMAEALGLAFGAEQSNASFFANGMQSKLAVSFPGRPDPEATDRLREHIADHYAGAANHHKPLILTQGGSATTLSMSAEDAQLLEARKFSVIDICRFFGVDPVLIGEHEKTSSWGSGVEQMGRFFHTLTMNPHFIAIEQELEVKLFGDGHFAEFDETELTRGDTRTRAEYNKAALGSLQQPGWMTVNEVRATENLAPVPNGDDLQRPDQSADQRQEVTSEQAV